MNGAGGYRDRIQAGQILGAAVHGQLGAVDAVVLALPRGGVPVGHEVASVINAPLDVFVVRKLGVPSQPEYAMGAIAPDGYELLDESLVARLRLTPSQIASVVSRERAELQRREVLYRGSRAPVEVGDRIVLVVDDGLATGFTMRAAVGALRRRGPKQVIVAVPVGAPETCALIAPEVDLLICPFRPEEFLAVGQWYQDFEASTDHEVAAYLASAARRRSGHHYLPTPR